MKDIMSRSKEKRLAILIPKLSFGGAERIVSYLSLHAPENIDIHIILFKKSITYPVKHTIYHIGDYNNILEAIKTFIRFNILLTKIRPDALLLFGAGQGLTFTLFSICKNKFYTIRNYFFEPYKRSPYHVLYFRFLISYATRLLARKIIVISHPIKYKLMQKYKLPSYKIDVIHNPVDISLISKLALQELSEKYSSFFNNPVLINVGRMIYQKGQWHLIRLFKKVNEEIPETRLAILGHGELEEYLKKLVLDLGLSEKVLFLGWQDNPFKYMHRSTLFCLTSLWEGFSNVILEALACGLPVMSADCLSGPREILAPRTRYKVSKLTEPEYGEYGILMPIMDGRRYTAKEPLTWQEELWAEEIIKLLKNPVKLKEYRKKSLNRAKDFDVKKQVNKYFKILFNDL